MRKALVVAGALAGASLVAGCSGTVGVGANVVPKATVEQTVAQQLAAQVHQPLPTVTCPSDLPARVGAHIQCVLVAQGSTTRYPVTVTVNSVTNGTAHYSAQVGTQPLSS